MTANQAAPARADAAARRGDAELQEVEDALRAGRDMPTADFTRVREVLKYRAHDLASLVDELESAGRSTRSARALTLECLSKAKDVQGVRLRLAAWRQQGWQPAPSARATVVLALGNSGLAAEAEAELRAIEAEGYEVAPAAYLGVLRGCILASDERRAAAVLDEALRAGVRVPEKMVGDVHALSPVAAMRASLNDPSVDADQVVASMEALDLGLSATLVEGLLDAAIDAGNGPAADKVLAFAVRRAIRVPRKQVVRVAALLRPDVPAVTRLLEALEDAGQPIPDGVTHNLLMALADRGDAAAAREAYRRWAPGGPPPQSQLLTALAVAHLRSGEVEAGVQLVCEALRDGMSPSPRMLEAVARVDDLPAPALRRVLEAYDSAGGVLDDRAVVSLVVRMGAAVPAHLHEVALQGEMPNAAAALAAGLVERGDPDTSLATRLAERAIAFPASLDAHGWHQVLLAQSRVPRQVVETYERHIAGRSHDGDHHRRTYLEAMVSTAGADATGLVLDAWTSASTEPLSPYLWEVLLAALATSGRCDDLEVRYTRMLTCGTAPNAFTLNALLDGLLAAGRTSTAIEAMREHASRGVPVDSRHHMRVISALVVGEGAHRAQAYLDQCRARGEAVDGHVFGAVMQGWARLGDIAAVERLADDMQQDGVPLVAFHLGCLVEAYGRGGRIADGSARAWELIGADVAPDAQVLVALLRGWVAAEDPAGTAQTMARWEERGLAVDAAGHAVMALALASSDRTSALERLQRSLRAGPAVQQSDAAAEILRRAAQERDLTAAVDTHRVWRESDRHVTPIADELVTAYCACDALEQVLELLETHPPNLRQALSLLEVLDRSEAEHLARRVTDLRGSSTAAFAYAEVVKCARSSDQAAVHAALAAAPDSSLLPKADVAGLVQLLAAADEPFLALQLLQRLLDESSGVYGWAVGSVLDALGRAQRPDLGERLLLDLIERKDVGQDQATVLFNLQLRAWQRNRVVEGVRRLKEEMVRRALPMDRFTQGTIQAAALLEPETAPLRGDSAKTWVGLALHLRDVVHELTQPLVESRSLVKRALRDLPSDTHVGVGDKLGRALDKLDGLSLRLEEYLLLASEDRHGAASDLVEAVEWVLHRLSEDIGAAGITVHRSLSGRPSRPLLVVAPSLTLRIVIRALLTNAVDVLTMNGVPGPIIWISAMHTRADGGDWVDVLIRDNGPGVPADIANRIFDQGFTTKSERGLGLGLPLVQSVCEMQGGRVTLESTDGGAEFRLRLPSATGAAVSAAARHAPEALRRETSPTSDEDRHTGPHAGDEGDR